MDKGNKKIEVSESNLKAAFEVADESTRKVLAALFGNMEENEPSLEDYKTIRSYEDACKALGESVDEETLKKAGVPRHIVALMKLELVCKALWGGEVKVYPDPAGRRDYWFPFFSLYTPKEAGVMNDAERGCLLSANTGRGATAGFGCLTADNCFSHSVVHCGIRLCLDTKAKAEYFGKQFLELWAEAIVFNFSVGERVKELKEWR